MRKLLASIWAYSVRKIPFFLWAAVALLGTPDPAVAATPVLKIATFNIMWEENGIRAGNLALPVWKVRESSMIQLLREAAPDIVGLQEASPEQQRGLAEGLTAYTLIFHAATNNTNPILIRKSRLHVLASGAFTLNAEPEKPGTNIGIRSATWARLEDRETARQFTIYNFHLDHRSQGPTRQISAVRLAERMASEAGAHLLTGDFNTTESSPTMTFLYGKTLLKNDAGVRIRNPAPVTDTYHRLYPDQSRRIIDHVLVSGEFKVQEAGRIPSQAASDHDLFWASVSLSDGVPRESN